jgi:hypothetical protein
MNKSEQQIGYKTHILIGVRASGVMAVIADWPYVPPQAEVQTWIDYTREPYVTFALCTPTSIMPAERNPFRGFKPAPSRFGPPAPVRRR